MAVPPQEAGQADFCLPAIDAVVATILPRPGDLDPLSL
jgi:hypothetical protein